MENNSLIYIKNYQALNSLVNHNNSFSYWHQLPALIGKPITVFVDSGGISGGGFTGILIEVLSDSIKLITDIPSAPNIQKNCSHKKRRNNKFGTYTTIMLDHITAINYNFI